MHDCRVHAADEHGGEVTARAGRANHEPSHLWTLVVLQYFLQVASPELLSIGWQFINGFRQLRQLFSAFVIGHAEFLVAFPLPHCEIRIDIF